MEHCIDPEDLESSDWVVRITFMVLLYHFWSLTDPVPIHAHCMEKSSLDILPNIFFYVQFLEWHEGD